MFSIRDLSTHIHAKKQPLKQKLMSQQTTKAQILFNVKYLAMMKFSIVQLGTFHLDVSIFYWIEFRDNFTLGMTSSRLWKHTDDTRLSVSIVYYELE